MFFSVIFSQLTWIQVEHQDNNFRRKFSRRLTNKTPVNLFLTNKCYDSQDIQETQTISGVPIDNPVKLQQLKII